jgi:hypothetical protein
VNPNLSTAQADALLEILERGVLRIRLAAATGDAALAEAIADAVHNVPRLLREGYKWGWSVAYFQEVFLCPLIERYPDLAGLKQPLDTVDVA